MDASSDENAAANAVQKMPRQWRLQPQFGLRSLFVAGVIFSLFCAYAGRNLYRDRQRETAFEKLCEANARISESASAYAGSDDDEERSPSLLDSLRKRLSVAFGFENSRDVGFVMFLAFDEANDDDLRPLVAFPELRTLIVMGPGFTDASIAHVNALANLEELDIQGTEITVDGLSRISNSDRIRSLGYSAYSAADPNVLHAIARMRELRELSLDCDGVRFVELERFAPPAKLERLQLREGDVGFLRAFVDLPQLRFVSLDAPDFDDHEAAWFADAFEIKELKLGRTALTDASLERFAEMRSLRSIEFFAPLTIESATAFSLLRPDCEVRYLPDTCTGQSQIVSPGTGASLNGR